MRISRRTITRDQARATLERQQTLVLDALQAAGGRPVSYDALREAGVEFPASVISELELAGVDVERCQDGPHVVGARLRAPASPVTPRPDLPRPTRERLLPGWWLPRTGLIAGALLAVVLGIAVLAVAGRGGGATDTNSGGSRPRAHTVASRGGRSAAARPSRRGPGRAPARQRARPARTPEVVQRTPVSAALAAQLEAEGHGLVQAGQYAQAVVVLHRALTATGQRLDDCLQPVSETCLTYAYALYDLGRALLLGGRAAAAVGVLERRLEIENQRPVVAGELESARRQLG